MPSRLSTFIISGDMDPVGGYGRGIENIYNKMKANGITDVILKIYPEYRHELLNELNNYDVYKDIFKWCERVINLYKR